MHTKNFLVDESHNRQTVKAVSEGLPESNVVTTLALFIEAIDSVDTGTLVIAAKHEEVLRVLDFVG